MTWLDIFREFQTALVGALGFFGVCMTLWANAALARSQIEAQRAARRSAIRCALLAEFRSIKNAINRYAEDGQGKRPRAGHEAFVPRFKRPLTQDIRLEIGELGPLLVGEAFHGLQIIDAMDRSIGEIANAITEEFFVFDDVRFSGFHLAMVNNKGVLDEVISRLEKSYE